MADQTDPEFLTPTQAAKLLHVSPKTVGRWFDEGRFPGGLVTLGGHRRIPRAAVLAALTKMGVEPNRKDELS